ncbi:MAG: hypothetical protein JRI23_17220 [Deltaproteobacteria bacterium]|jgi:predicted CoA-substrate-specific enzyme activase|nr:hypothetical protein [Deltaproteobacteria bacterium]MBW2533560.1 hypothetical protein [Deltaproteobacteria bacterium]
MAPAPPPATSGIVAGLEIGSVSVKWVVRSAEGARSERVIAHGGDPRRVVGDLLTPVDADPHARAVVTGQAGKRLVALPYRSTTECLERALSNRCTSPDLLLTLGGETFRAYPMRRGTIRNVISTSKCAAGTGEFIAQQLQRMGMTLAEGLEQSCSGRPVHLATRCSVHCKSDATHMLNKGECTPGDIAASLIADLAKRARELIVSAEWPMATIVLAGGVAQNRPFVAALAELLPTSTLMVLPESPYLEAQGAFLHAQELQPSEGHPASLLYEAAAAFETLPPLSAAEQLLDYRIAEDRSAARVTPRATYLLGVDAGSTTTKAVLLDAETGAVAASSYLRTLGNPIAATGRCLAEIDAAIGAGEIRLVDVATTGSGREMVSVFLEGCLSINEIVAHARAAAHYLPEVSTVFEIGGQDSKLISFLDGIPIDYAMNEGCSAGTGSFLEESASLDMKVPMAEISAVAQSSTAPIAFGERCAAFINTDLRNALQQGARLEDVVAGLCYSIADNYISRVVGPRQLGEQLLFLGGVARNRAVALAVAARTGRKVVVPPHPELMGAVGAALKARDRLRERGAEERALRLASLAQGEMEVAGSFRCKACDNSCEVKKIRVGGRIYPFGGLCPKYELERRGRSDVSEGRDLVALRNRMMFEEYRPEPPAAPRGTVGIPLCLTAFELFPLYAKLVCELGYEVILSDTLSGGDIRTAAAICYPCQLAHRAVGDLLDRGVDFVLLPRVLDLEIPDGRLHSYTCPSTSVVPDIITAAHPAAKAKLLTPHIGLSRDLADLTLLEIERLAPAVDLAPDEVRQAAQRALEHYRAFRRDYAERGRQELAQIAGEPTVVVAGRPYSVYSPEVNLALPRKIASRGFHAVPADMVPPRAAGAEPRDAWHFTQQISSAIAFAGATPGAHVCLVSCFSCGPDSVMYHDFRRELAGSAFCYLEIDSHTAHAGFETRVGAFLDIVEERERQGKASPADPADATRFERARLTDELDAFLDSDGARVEYGDPRVVHVLTDVANPHAAKLVQAVYEKAGRRCRIAAATTAETMARSKGVCSGRECVPLVATVGAALQDLETARADDELTVYLTLDQEGPCQNGAWPAAWRVFVERLQVRNVIGGIGRSSANRQLGLAGTHLAEVNQCVLLGDLLTEAEHALQVVAQEPSEAQQRFRQAVDTLATALREGRVGLLEGLEAWSAEMARIPLRLPVGNAPKVLIFGGLNVSFVHRPVTEYFIERGVIPKVIDIAEGIASVASEAAIRTGLEHGHVEPAAQLGFTPPREPRAKFLAARMARFGVSTIEKQIAKLREAMTGSGLLFDEPIPFADLLQAGHAHVSNAGFSETGITVGRYACSAAGDLYDGLVNLGCFNCQPAMSSQAIIRPLAGRADVPYVAIDCEGPWISAGQAEALETVAVQATRVRTAKLDRTGAPPANQRGSSIMAR